ncbi:ThiF family adenylyltransferase [Hymenobacter saemangeumensis]|uniref:ThiF family adenylyltransferase n=1 Tax=Hymenobacter saemangeumensis TaxID=1084522 RepID=A0ABP8IQV6_9BACT
MSQQPINRSADLQRLRNEGYDVEVKGGYLLVKGVPYVTASKAIAYGTLASALSLAGEVTTKPATHVAYFAGEHPCHKDGTKMSKIEHQSNHMDLGNGLIMQHSFSSKPRAGYSDYYEKVATYVALISSPAQAIDASVTAKSFPVIEPTADESVFCYTDTASTRARISAVTEKLAYGNVAIIGLGGTGTYVLDLVAKTPVKQIRLFDGDVFSQHNAFRSPGAPTVDELRTKPQKVDYFASLYSNMHRHIIPHDGYLDETNLEGLQGMDFVFLCLDRGSVKQVLIAKLEALSIPFIDVGMGIYLHEKHNSLGGIVRVTASTPQQRGHVHDKKRISFGDEDAGNEYQQNIQIADLNALNAALAVIKWKKLAGFYLDLEAELHSTYTLDGNILQNEDHSV